MKSMYSIFITSEKIQQIKNLSINYVIRIVQNIGFIFVITINVMTLYLKYVFTVWYYNI